MALVIEGQADFSQAQRSIDDFSKKSRIALTNLSLVVQDLPYGFIGIQNNLPALTQSFAQLSAEAGGTKNALKQIAAGLVGPAGLFLAFSAVTSAVTFAITKYGSLSNAINALFSANSKLIQIQQELNKELAKSTANTIQEESRLKVLAKTMNDSLKPMRERQNAYIAAKKIAPEIANGIGKENSLTERNIELINQNIQKRIEFLKLRARENAILSIINKNEEERIALEQEYPALLDKKNKAEIAYNKTRGLTFDATKTFNAALDTEAINFDSASKALEKNAAQRRNLYKINNDLLSQLDPLINQTSQYDAESQRFFETLKKGTKVQDDYKKGWKGIIDAIEELRVKTQKGFQNEAAFKASQLQKQAAKNTADALQYAKGMQGIVSALMQRDGMTMADPFPFDFTKIEEGFKKINLETTFLNLRNILTNVFFTPLEDAFVNLFETGKFNLKSFGDAFLKEIQRIVARVIATGIISLLSNLITFGAGGIAGKLASVSTDSLGAFLGGGVMNPSFAGVGAGSFGMSGQVNLVLRGQDLVGSINRTNATINRVG